MIAEIEEKIRTKLLVEGVKPKKKGAGKKMAATEAAAQDPSDLPTQEPPMGEDE